MPHKGLVIPFEVRANHEQIIQYFKNIGQNLWGISYSPIRTVTDYTTDTETFKRLRIEIRLTEIEQYLDGFIVFNSYGEPRNTTEMTLFSDPFKWELGIGRVTGILLETMNQDGLLRTKTDWGEYDIYLLVEQISSMYVGMIHNEMKQLYYTKDISSIGSAWLNV